MKNHRLKSCNDNKKYRVSVSRRKTVYLGLGHFWWLRSSYDSTRAVSCSMRATKSLNDGSFSDDRRRFITRLFHLSISCVGSFSIIRRIVSGESKMLPLELLKLCHLLILLRKSLNPFGLLKVIGSIFRIWFR